jgi:hypothetical protein
MKPMIGLVGLCLVSLASAGQVPAADRNETRYSVVIMGNKAGFETSRHNADGSRELYYEFNDRGRGPKIRERITLDKRGIPTHVESSGNDYDKDPVEEHFSLHDGRATWKNRAEQRQTTVPDKAFYVSLSGVPEEQALLAEALLLAGGRLSLLPAGEASIEKRGQLKIEANGQSRVVTQYAISGLDFAPSAIWLDQGGQFFASINGAWFSFIREGWESAAESLAKAQEEFEKRRSADLASRLRHKPAGPLAFVRVKLFDSETGTTHPGSTVVIRGNKIETVATDGHPIAITNDTEVIDGAGKTLVPGLWDMHVHLGPNDGLLNIANGVTSVRDLANDMETLMAMRARFDSGAEIGPRILMAGFIDGRGPYQGPTKVFADTEEEAQKDVEMYARNGYVQIKVYSSLKPELVPKIVEMAHSHGMRVSGHVPAFMTAEQFVRDGADEIQHMNFIFLNFMFDTVQDTRTPARFTEVAKHGAEVDPNSPKVQAFIHVLQEHKTVLDPTLNVFEGLFTDRPGPVSAIYAAIGDRLPAQIRRQFMYGGLQPPEGLDQRYRDSFQQMLKMTKTLYDAGIPIVAGTDALAGFALHHELELYEQAGIPAAKVLQLDTIGAARVMKRDKELGSIAPGKLADMILVDGDPSVHVSDVRRVITVVKDGNVYKVADLDQALGVKP